MYKIVIHYLMTLIIIKFQKFEKKVVLLKNNDRT